MSEKQTFRAKIEDGREHVLAILEAKQEATRKKRIASLIDGLKS